MTLTDDIRAAAARVAREAESVRIVEDADRGLRARAARRGAADARPRGRRRRDAGGVQPAAERDQLRQRLVSHDPQARRAVGLPDDGGRAARPRALDGAASCERSRARRSRARSGQDPEHVLMGLFETPPAASWASASTARSWPSRSASTAPPRRSRPSSPAGRPGSDVSPYPSGDVPLFKRAQIAAADLALAGIAPASDLRPPDAVRRQPRPARAADRRRARVRRRPRATHRRTARCSSTTRARRSRSAPSRCTRSNCSSQAHPRRHHRRRSSTGSCGHAAPRRATRPTPATAPRPRPTDGADPRGATVTGPRRPGGLPRAQARAALRRGDPRGRGRRPARTSSSSRARSRPTSKAASASSPPRRAARGRACSPSPAARRFDLEAALPGPARSSTSRRRAHLGNLGAAIRVAAAADAAAVLTTGQTTRGTRTRSAAPPACTSRCRSRASTPPPHGRPLIAHRPRGRGDDRVPRRPDPRLRLRAPRPQRRSCSSAPTRGCGSPCAPASPASTSRPPWPRSSTASGPWSTT